VSEDSTPDPRITELGQLADELRKRTQARNVAAGLRNQIEADRIRAAIEAAQPGLAVVALEHDIVLIKPTLLHERIALLQLSGTRNGDVPESPTTPFPRSFVVDKNGFIYEVTVAFHGPGQTRASRDALDLATIIGPGAADAVVKALTDAIKRGLSGTPEI
jgi:hypothetical protein